MLYLDLVMISLYAGGAARLSRSGAEGGDIMVRNVCVGSENISRNWNLDQLKANKGKVRDEFDPLA